MTNGDLGSPFRILLVEDNSIDARVTVRATKRLRVDTTVEHVDEGRAALDRLRTSGSIAALPDLVLLDLNLAGFDGFELLTAVKSDEALCRIPVVVLSTSSRDADIYGAYDRGANAYVTKPARLEGWDAVVEQIASFWLGLTRRTGS